ncbi:uncharacterized protein EDB91DRAFT_1340646 [Suillus paluster]|uniref:uncharacterized protein n=1 Tax=Suillus paluster TaxID=48578 RepID=UPI001B878BE9|nr:uncharacterized protein EDB91DRAFT_1340646 [Suillus paluster]KAG1720544.1 hypothetical protein EDB91DRAFT_1340646 [Suillus paluster]
MVHAEDIPPDTENQQDDGNIEGMQSEHHETSTTNTHSQQSAVPAASVQAHQRRRIAQLEEKLEALESGRVVKEKQANYYAAQGRAIRCIVALFDNIEDLIAENDRRYEGGDEDHTIDQDRLQIGNGSEMEHDEYMQMLKMVGFTYSMASYHSTIDQYRHHESLYITIKFGQDLIFASLLFFLLLYPSLGVDVVGAGTGAGALNSALFPPAPPPPNYFRIFDHLANLFSDSHFLLFDPLLLAPFPPLPSRIFAIFTICSLASSSFISLHVL